MIPIQLRLVLILFAVFFFLYTIYLVRKDKAEVRQMQKWLVLSFVLLLGAFLPKLGLIISKILGVHTTSSMALIILVLMIIVMMVRFHLTLIQHEKANKELTQ